MIQCYRASMALIHVDCAEVDVRTPRGGPLASVHDRVAWVLEAAAVVFGTLSGMCRIALVTAPWS
jgi:hypothetical protein